MRLICVLIIFLFSLPASAQTNIIQKLRRDVPGQGKVTIHQDESVTALIGGKRTNSHKKAASETQKRMSKAVNGKSDTVTGGNIKHKNIGKDGVAPSMSLVLDDMEDEAPRKIVKVAGYRVQVYAGNNTRNAKLEALRVASDVRSFFPEVSVYSFFSPPRWLCRVGDYRSMEEAYTMMRKLKATRVFHEVSIVKDRVNVSL